MARGDVGLVPDRGREGPAAAVAHAFERDHRGDRRRRLGELFGIARAHDDVGVGPGLREERIGADRDVRMRLLRPRASAVPISPSRSPARTVSDSMLHAGPQRRRDDVEHRLHDRGHAGHDMDIADVEARRLRDGIGDQVGAGRDARHAQPRLVELVRRKALGQHRDGARIMVDRDAEGRGHRIGGDVVMGRADAAGGEDVGVAGAQRIQRRDDLLVDIGDDADLAQVDADIGQVLGDVADILVLGPARQDLVADHQDRGGHRALLARLASLAVMADPRPVGRRLARRAIASSSAGDALLLGVRGAALKHRAGPSSGCLRRASAASGACVRRPD